MMSGATGAKAIREVVKLLLVDLPDHHRHRALQDLVLEGRNTDRTGLRPIALRDVHPSHRRRPVSPRLCAVQQRLAPLSGDRLENDYVETAVAADMPFPVTARRRGCR